MATVRGDLDGWPDDLCGELCLVFAQPHVCILPRGHESFCRTVLPTIEAFRQAIENRTGRPATLTEARVAHRRCYAASYVKEQEVGA